AVLIVLTRLNRILTVDAANRSALVEPGVVNARLSAATRPHGLHYAPDPSSQSACTIGGNVAENAGGPHCLKYGVTANHILALEVLLADGSLAEIGSPGGESWGPDLVGVFVGSEGNFGIATRITVRLTPLPRAVRTLLADFTGLRTAGEAVSAIIAAGIVPAALEMMDQSCICAVEDSVYAAGYPRDAAAVLLVEIDGRNTDAVVAETEVVVDLLRKSGARSVRSAASEAERERLWQGRKKAFGAMGRLSRDLVVQDAVVPRSALPDVLDTISTIAKNYGLVVSNVFHAGDGNLHPNISFDATNPTLKHSVEVASAEIMATCIAAGGTITGEHGVGIDKLRYMPLIFDAESLGAMLAVRREHRDRKSTRLNSSHVSNSYAVFCLKKKTVGPDIAGLDEIVVAHDADPDLVIVIDSAPAHRAVPCSESEQAPAEGPNSIQLNTRVPVDLDTGTGCQFFFQSYAHHRDLHSFPTRRSSD